MSDEVSEPFSKDVGLTRRMHDLVREHPDFEVLCEPEVDVYCFRYVPNGLAELQEESEVQVLLDRLNQEIVEAVQSNLLATTHVRSGVAIRMSICSHRTSREDIDATFEAIARWGRLLKKLSHYEMTPDKEAQLCLSESHSSPTEVSVT